MQCRKCGPLGDDMFYVSNRTKCKECIKAAVHQRRIDFPERISAYEVRRMATPKRRRQMADHQTRHRKENPDKYRARSAVGAAVRDGRLIPQPCAFCGRSDKVQAHHHDYSRPLDVEWACFKCHREREHGQVVVSDCERVRGRRVPQDRR